jgi:hypothetical protein
VIIDLSCFAVLFDVQMHVFNAGAQVQEFCGFGTKEECSRSNTNAQSCDKLHFKKIISKHTDGKW